MSKNTYYRAYTGLYSKWTSGTLSAMRALAFDFKQKLEVEEVNEKTRYTVKTHVIDGTSMRKRPKVRGDEAHTDIAAWIS